jgi:hypothetical protein
VWRKAECLGLLLCSSSSGRLDDSPEWVLCLIKFGGVSMTENVKLEVKGNELVIRVALNETFGTSGSGKSEIIASTGGNISLPGREEVKIGLNVYRPVRR